MHHHAHAPLHLCPTSVYCALLPVATAQALKGTAATAAAGATSSRTQETGQQRRAAIKGGAAPPPPLFRSAPARSSSRTQPLCPPAAASCNAVLLLPSRLPGGPGVQRLLQLLLMTPPGGN